MDETRLDKWLWSVRACRTRPEAATLCRNGRVQVNGRDAKPGRDVHIDETVTIRVGLVTRTLRVLGHPRSRVGAKQLAAYVEDLTPAAEYDRARQASLEHLLARERGRGRPTKKERRDMGRLFGFD
jgi:ribosome-associated heat shock protein Hsp15